MDLFALLSLPIRESISAWAWSTSDSDLVVVSLEELEEMNGAGGSHNSSRCS